MREINFYLFQLLFLKSLLFVDEQDLTLYKRCFQAPSQLTDPLFCPSTSSFSCNTQKRHHLFSEAIPASQCWSDTLPQASRAPGFASHHFGSTVMDQICLHFATITRFPEGAQGLTDGFSVSLMH